MRIAVYSDVHGNLPALQAFIKHSVERGVQCYEFLGDAVNYGGKPQECLDEIIKLGLVGHIKEINAFTDPNSLQKGFIESYYNERLQGKILLGNNDAACCGLENPDYFADHARESALITRNKLLSEWHQKFLRNLPIEAPMNIYNESVPNDHEDHTISIRYNHSAPGNINLGEWHYVRPHTNDEHIEYFFENFEERICFVGHSHTPCAFVQVKGQTFPVSFPLPTKNYDKALINVGAVGQPRGQVQGSYIIIDAVQRTIELEWFCYDIRQAMNDIIEAGLPKHNAHRLQTGRLPRPKMDNTDSKTFQA